ncbi:GntR family transcriptional regulator [Lysinibacillus sp. SGAir0095]|uniref:GntR family transcriptional regulator n=1 Tax=Lysinibacillus sp. SGAir0095 TaxID=2070463 RepID=UPI0010CD671E|nr:GntR family transcriptional regulator [Lysinibacillus sp. SGAir0095]QCR33687.1 GntR family transcriptional regulator [Lysinibacillus sp. SGAir0095]
MQVVNPNNSNAYRLAYESIRNMIISGELNGGIKLVEERLAEKIGVSRTPVREAIRHLEQEGLIKNKRVYKPTKEDLLYSSELITLIESYAAKKAAENMTKEKLSQLKQALKESKKGTFDEIVSVNMKFHELIIAECNNPVMIEEIQKVNTVYNLYRRLLIKNKRPLLYEEHQEIYEAIASKNGDLASELMRKHLKLDLKYMLRYSNIF